MTHTEKVMYMKVAAGVCNFGIENEHLDLLVSLYELVCEKEASATIDDICKVQTKVKERANVKKRSQLLDKVAKKRE